MYNYIPLPTNLKDFPEVLTLRIEEGTSGYGVYVMVLQLLRDMPDYSMVANAKRIAFAINEADVSLVERVISKYGLFETDTLGRLSSPWLSEQLSAYDTKKKKLQEAGRRGAARRYGSNEDREAIATLSNGDREAIAIQHNITQPNITKENTTTPPECACEDWKAICLNQGKKVDDELVIAMVQSQPEGHAPGYVAQICRQYGIGENVLTYLLSITDNANTNDSRYKALCGIIQRIQREHYIPTYPANFFCSKI